MLQQHFPKGPFTLQRISSGNKPIIRGPLCWALEMKTKYNDIIFLVRKSGTFGNPNCAPLLLCDQKPQPQVQRSTPEEFLSLLAFWIWWCFIVSYLKKGRSCDLLTSILLVPTFLHNLVQQCQPVISTALGSACRISSLQKGRGGHLCPPFSTISKWASGFLKTVSSFVPLVSSSLAMKNNIVLLVGAFNNLEKHESQWEGLSHISWKIKNAPNHQPVYIYIDVCGVHTRLAMTGHCM